MRNSFAMGALFVGFVAAGAWAFCPDENAHGRKAVTTASSTGEHKGGCGHKNTAVAGEATGAPCAHASKSSGCCKSKNKSAVEAVLASMPTMKYQVGEEVTCCPNAAKAMASASEGSPKAVKYRVGEEAFETEQAATVKLAAVLQKHLDEMQAMQFSVAGETCYCPMRAKELASSKNTTMAYRVGGFDFAEREKAEKAMKLAAEAANSVQLVCKTGDKNVECNSAADAKLTYVVGESETDSKEAAQLLALQAKIRKVVETAASVFTA